MQQIRCDPQSEILPEVEPVRQASRQLVRELGFLDHRLGTLGISHSQCHALIELERQEMMTAGELAAALNLDKSTMSRTLAALVKSGLVASRSGAGDRRRRPLVLTAKGRRKTEQIHRQADRQVQTTLASLGPDDRAAVVRGMSLYARALGRLRNQAEFVIRPITRRDDRAIGQIIRTVMTEHGASGPGFAILDPEVDAMTKAYGRAGHGYFVLARGERVVGGAGFGQLTGTEEPVCELRKMYFMPEARGVGMGARLLGHVLEQATGAGYRACYLETLRSMGQARRLYEAFGFRPISGAMGATGHFRCDAWYLKELATGDG